MPIKATIVNAIYIFLSMSCMHAYNQEISIYVLDNEGQPVQDAVVSLQPQTTRSDTFTITQKPKSRMAIMNQVDRQFEPHVLVIQKGTSVNFPNSDNIFHHIYSFSEAKTFEVDLYKGSEVPPVLFNAAGIVTLGCNIHDWMLGYIYVTESPLFGKSDDAGLIQLSVPPETYDVKLWHPRLKNNNQVESHILKVGSSLNYTFNFKASLSTPISSFQGFDEY